MEAVTKFHDERDILRWFLSPVERDTRLAPTGVATARRPMPEVWSKLVT